MTLDHSAKKDTIHSGLFPRPPYRRPSSLIRNPISDDQWRWCQRERSGEATDRTAWFRGRSDHIVVPALIASQKITPSNFMQSHTILKSSTDNYVNKPVLVLGGKGDVLRKVAERCKIYQFFFGSLS